MKTITCEVDDNIYQKMAELSAKKARSVEEEGDT
jgi:hypothetical protein